MNANEKTMIKLTKTQLKEIERLEAACNEAARKHGALLASVEAAHQAYCDSHRAVIAATPCASR